MNKFLALLERLHLNRVFLTSLIFSLAIVVQEMNSNKDQSLKAYALAIAIAAIGFLSNTWKGKGFSLAGQLMAAVPALVERANGEPINWTQLILTVVLAFLMARFGGTTPAGGTVENTGEATPNDAPNF